MKTTKLAYLLFILAMALSYGCIKTGTKEIVMPDQEIGGNQGFLKGNAPYADTIREPKTKKIIDIEIEVPSLYERKSEAVLDKDVWGNQGYVMKSGAQKGYIYVEPVNKKTKKDVESKTRKTKEIDALYPFTAKDSIQSDKLKKTELKYMEYRVREGESLWIIAKKIYGDATKWPLIYEENKEIIADPKVLKPGTILRVPIAEDSKGDFIK